MRDVINRAGHPMLFSAERDKEDRSFRQDLSGLDSPRNFQNRATLWRCHWRCPDWSVSVAGTRVDQPARATLPS